MTIDLGPTSSDWLPAIADYQGAVARLTAENKALDATLNSEREASRVAVQKLRVQLTEGLTPELLVLRREVRKWRMRARAAEARFTASNREGAK